MNDRIEAALVALPKATPGPWNLAVALIDGNAHFAIAGPEMKEGDTGPAVCVISPMLSRNDKDVMNGIMLATAPDLAAEVVRLRAEVTSRGAELEILRSDRDEYQRLYHEAKVKADRLDYEIATGRLKKEARI